jgi:hypothetical protein
MSIRDEVVETIRDRDVALTGRVLVPQGGTRT